MDGLCPFYLGDLSGYAHFLLYHSMRRTKIALAVGFLARSKTSVISMRQSLGMSSIEMGDETYLTTDFGEASHWDRAEIKYMDCGRDHFTYCLGFHPKLGGEWMITCRDFVSEDLYDHLMVHYKLPLLREWMPVLLDRLLDKHFVRKEPVCCIPETGITIPLHGKAHAPEDLFLLKFECLSEEDLEATVSGLLRSGEIRFSEKPQTPLKFDGMDGYFNAYGTAAIKNLHENLRPLTDLHPNVRNLALKNKSLFPQQAASVEGIVAMEGAGHKYAVLNHGMGCGKSVESASACEAIAVGKWLKAHPDKTLKDAYERDGIINYRTIIMAPGHLVDKWRTEVMEEIPYAKVTTIRGLKELTELRAKGRKAANGKEFYVISKDRAKLGTQTSPIPTKVGWRKISLGICADCADEDGRIIYKAGAGRDAVCPTCGGRHFRPVPQDAYGSFKGMICPHCGELLLKFGSIRPDVASFQNDPSSYVLAPKDFARPNKGNSACYHCGASLWGANAKPIVTGCLPEKEPKWRKVSHYANYSKKSRESAYVLRGFESDYLDGKVQDGMTYQSQVYGPRKAAPSGYVKKHLKGFFDFCILDEAHKYLGDSAQAVSAHALVKASRFTMALTGTISNGTAACFYNLFFMMEPKRLIDMGYGYGANERQRFCENYGCVEREYEAVENTRNVMSRGKPLGMPRVKPGISPMLFGALLMDCSLFMDISDLSKYLPALREQVVVVETPPEVRQEYRRVLDVLGKSARFEGLGMSILAQQLNFGLTYPDKPYGRKPIMNPYVEDAAVCLIANFKEYAEGALLPKETKLIELIRQEMSEGRNCFVYATATNGADACITGRLKEIIEEHCNLSGRVDVIESSSPQACDREAWFHRRAAEGIRVFITNPRCVETGLDFCFRHEGRFYNFPTIIFYQTTYELATIWQASRRAYRLSQKEECRTFYLAYENTIQVTALQIMAKKQVATAAIQGHFSAEGLASMAQGVDARTLLAQALSERDMGSSDSLADMFDVLAKGAGEEEDEYGAFTPSKNFYELTGRSIHASLEIPGDQTCIEAVLSEFGPFEEAPVRTPVADGDTPAKRAAAELEELLGIREAKPANAAMEAAMELSVLLCINAPAPEAKRKRKGREAQGQLSLADLLAI